MFNQGGLREGDGVSQSDEQLGDVVIEPGPQERIDQGGGRRAGPSL